jgi:hypothetical protein
LKMEKRITLPPKTATFTTIIARFGVVKLKDKL